MPDQEHPGGYKPDRIEVTNKIYAVNVGKIFVIHFPFHRDAVARMRMVGSAHFDHFLRNWYMRAHDRGRVHEVLQDLATTLTRAGVDIGTPSDSPAAVKKEPENAAEDLDFTDPRHDLTPEP